MSTDVDPRDRYARLQADIRDFCRRHPEAQGWLLNSIRHEAGCAEKERARCASTIGKSLTYAEAGQLLARAHVESGDVWGAIEAFARATP